MNSIPYLHTSEMVSEKDPPLAKIRVRIDPQYHEMIVEPSLLQRDAQRMNVPPEEALRYVMLDHIRGQAVEAYQTVMRGGLTALAGRPTESHEVEDAISCYVEQAARQREAAEAESKKWQDLAEKRGIEINALERALARRLEN